MLSGPYATDGRPGPLGEGPKTSLKETHGGESIISFSLSPSGVSKVNYCSRSSVHTGSALVEF